MSLKSRVTCWVHKLRTSPGEQQFSKHTPTIPNTYRATQHTTTPSFVNPSKMLPTTHSSNPRSWNASTLLKIPVPIPGCIRLGRPPSTKQTCPCLIPAANIKAANLLVEILPHLSIWEQELQRCLLELASLMLCRRVDQEKAQGIADHWFRKIVRELQRRGQAVGRPQAPPASSASTLNQPSSHIQ